MSSDAASKIAEYVRKGWKLSSLHCPVCSTPLVNKGDKYFCAVCNREVRVVKSDEEYREALTQSVLEELKMQLVNAIQRIYLSEDWYFNKEYLEYLTKYLTILKLIKEIGR